jgi:hypothetical protein
MAAATAAFVLVALGMWAEIDGEDGDETLLAGYLWAKRLYDRDPTPLPRNGRSIRGMGTLLAASTLLLTMPSATDSQVSARVVIVTRPTAAIHSPASAVGRKPRRSATTTTTASLSMVWIVLPRTCPASTEAPFQGHSGARGVRLPAEARAAAVRP